MQLQPRRQLTKLQRFESFIVKLAGNYCWLWNGAVASGGYGIFDGERVNRFAYKQYVCQEIPDGKWVLHNCGNKSCVNPKHLYIGTPLDNTDFAWKNNECRIGISHKLTKKEVIEIREIWNNSKPIFPGSKKRWPSLAVLASRYNVSPSCISSTIKDKTGKGIMRGNSGVKEGN